MIKWDQEQKDRIWKLYTDQQLSFAQIAQRYSHLGATRQAIAGLIGRMNMARDDEVDKAIEVAKKRAERGLKNKMQGTPRGGYLKKKRSDNKLTEEEISNIRTLKS